MVSVPIVNCIPSGMNWTDKRKFVICESHMASENGSKQKLKGVEEKLNSGNLLIAMIFCPLLEELHRITDSCKSKPSSRAKSKWMQWKRLRWFLSWPATSSASGSLWGAAGVNSRAPIASYWSWSTLERKIFKIYVAIMRNVFQEGCVGPSHGRLGQAWPPSWLLHHLLRNTG